MEAESPETPRRKVRGSLDILWFLGVLVFWFVLQSWVLPRFGVST